MLFNSSRRGLSREFFWARVNFAGSGFHVCWICCGIKYWCPCQELQGRILSILVRPSHQIYDDIR